MLFEKKVVDMVLGQLLTRQDNPHGIFYFEPQDFPGLHAKAHGFKSHKGHDLKGYFYCYEGADPEKLVVFDHGMGNGHRAYMREIETLCRAGFLVYSYDHTGCMASGGAHIGGFSQSLADLDDCIKHLKREPLMTDREIYVVGHSWGGFSTMNIGAIHPEVKIIVSMSGFVSVERIVKQSLGPLKPYTPAIVRAEQLENPRHSRFNGLESLEKTKAKVLLIYSEDDKTVLKKEHYDPLYIKFCDSDRVKFLLLNGKNHNPTYENESVIYKDDFFGKFQKALKKGQLSTTESQKDFFGKFDWWFMTKQDMAVWNQITDFLKA